jgi:hypothetical protein
VVDLGPQPWVNCTSRSWHEYGGSVTFPFSENHSFETQKIIPLTLWIFDPFSVFYFPGKRPPKDDTNNTLLTLVGEATGMFVWAELRVLICEIGPHDLVQTIIDRYCG